MSLDITFYGKNGQEPTTIELEEKFYEWLAKSDFSEIGTAQTVRLTIDGEEDEHNVIDLNKGIITNRQRFVEFFKEAILQESEIMLKNLGESPSKEEYQQESYKCKKLYEILEYLKNQQYSFLERVT